MFAACLKNCLGKSQMSPLSLRLRFSRSRGLLALGLIVGLGFVVALHHADLMPMDNGHDGRGTSVEMTGAMICFGVLAIGFALAPEIGGMIGRFHRPERSAALYVRPLALSTAPPPLARAGPPCSQVFRL